MSDLTITTAGVSESKVTGGEFLSGDKKLNQMKVDLIDVTLATQAANVEINDVTSDYVEIPNAVAVKGGVGVIQSIQLLDEANQGAAIDLVFQTDNTTIGSTDAAVSIADADARDILGFVSMTNYFSGIAWKLASKQNIGLVVKAASDTRSIYVAAVNRGGTVTYGATDAIKLRIGIIQD
tara:strand:+ start:57 stop:596 length:540 start_codon:yes stop_codon:yes gene_type:complete